MEWEIFSRCQLLLPFMPDFTETGVVFLCASWGPRRCNVINGFHSIWRDTYHMRWNIVLPKKTLRSFCDIIHLKIVFFCGCIYMYQNCIYYCDCFCVHPCSSSAIQVTHLLLSVRQKREFLDSRIPQLNWLTSKDKIKLLMHSCKKCFCLREPIFWGGIFLILRRKFPNMEEDFPNIEEKFS